MWVFQEIRAWAVLLLLALTTLSHQSPPESLSPAGLQNAGNTASLSVWSSPRNKEKGIQYRTSNVRWQMTLLPSRLCQICTMAGGSSRAEKKSLLVLWKPRSRAALSEPGLNGSTGDPDPVLSGKQQASINSWCYYWIRIINTSAILRGKWCVVAGSAGGQGAPFC